MTVLQAKLHQAAKRDPTRRCHALYDKLSLDYVLASAWQLVRRNDGAAGIDPQTLEELEAAGVEAFLAEVAQALREGSYRPQPVRRVLIPKGNGATRPLGIPTVRDRVGQAAAKLLLEPIFEADFEGCSFGFRPGTGQQEALAAVRDHSRQGYRWVVDGDLQQFFDTLDHPQLMTALRRRRSDGALLRVIYRWLKAGYRWAGSYYDTDQGSPQGGVLSPLLANVYLHAFDQASRTQKTFVGHLTRFADDFVIQCGTPDHAHRALAWVQATLAGLRLTLHPEKTRVVEDREGFDFLGFHHRRVPLRGQGGRDSWGVLRWPSRKSQQRYRHRVREVLGTPGQLRRDWSARLTALTRYARGWVQYYRHGERSRVFGKLDRDLAERGARQVARSQPRGKKRQQRSWEQCLAVLREWGKLPALVQLQRGPFPPRKSVGIRWRAG